MKLSLKYFPPVNQKYELLMYIKNSLHISFFKISVSKSGHEMELGMIDRPKGDPWEIC